MSKYLKRFFNSTGHAVCEICGENQILNQHHINGRKIKNANHPTNIANLCSNCHVKVHHGIYICEKRALTTEGYKLIWHYSKKESITGDNGCVHLV